MAIRLLPTTSSQLLQRVGFRYDLCGCVPGYNLWVLRNHTFFPDCTWSHAVTYYTYSTCRITSKCILFVIQTNEIHLKNSLSLSLHSSMYYLKDNNTIGIHLCIHLSTYVFVYTCEKYRHFINKITPVVKFKRHEAHKYSKDDVTAIWFVKLIIGAFEQHAL